MSRLCAVRIQPCFTIFKKEVKPVRNPVLRRSGLLACLNDRFLVDTKKEIMFGNGCENGGVCLRLAANNEAKVANT